MRSNFNTRRQGRPPTSRRFRFIERLEPRTLLAAGIIELGASDNIALDQPRVAVEFAKDIDPGPGVQWESIGPGLFNTFLLDTGASSVLTMATAIADIEQSRLGWEVQGALLEAGVAGDHLLDVSIPYRFDFAGSNGIRHTLLRCADHVRCQQRLQQFWTVGAGRHAGDGGSRDVARLHRLVGRRSGPRQHLHGHRVS